VCEREKKKKKKEKKKKKKKKVIRDIVVGQYYIKLSPQCHSSVTLIDPMIGSFFSFFHKPLQRVVLATVDFFLGGV